MAYKIGSDNIISNTGISNSSLPQLSIDSTRLEIAIPIGDNFRYVIGDNRLVFSNSGSITIQHLNSNEYSTTFSASVSSYSDVTVSASRTPLGIGDGLVVVGNPLANTYNTRAGSASVYDYSGNFKFSLQPTTNVIANVYFGHSVSIKSNLISVCSFESNVGNFNPGTIYVYYANGNLKSKTYRPISPSLSDFTKKNFSGILIDGYRILASDLYASSANGAATEAGAVYLFATDNTRIFTSNQQVDIGSTDRFGSEMSYSEGIIHVSSPYYESQTAPFPLNDGLITGLTLQGALAYRYDPGSSGSGMGTYLASGGGYVVAGRAYSRSIAIINSRGQFIQTITLPSDATASSYMYIYNSKLYVQGAGKLYSYELPQSHSSYYDSIIKNKKRYY
jgi:hypothetical protein